MRGPPERVKTELRSCWPMMLRYPESFHHRTCTRPRSRWRICFDDGMPEWDSEMYGDVRCRWRKHWDDVRRAEDEREDQTPAASMRRQISHQWGTGLPPPSTRLCPEAGVYGNNWNSNWASGGKKFRKISKSLSPLQTACSRMFPNPRNLQHYCPFVAFS